MICDCFSIDIFCSKKQNQCKLDLKHDLEYVKDSFDVTPVHDHDDASEKASEKAHKVILVALSSFFRNYVSLEAIIIVGKSSFNRVSYPNAVNYYTINVTQRHCTEISFKQRQH